MSILKGINGEWLGFLLTLLFITGSQSADSVCYKGLGCFNQTAPWVNEDRPFPLPQSPEELNVTITFFSRQEKKGQQFEIYPNVTFTQGKGGYKQTRRVAVIVHGYGGKGSDQWALDLKDAYLRRVDANVFVVNWEMGANGNYLQAAANTRVVGVMLGLFGTNLFLVHKSSVRYHHMIADGLGAHLAAYAAVGMNKRSKAGKIIKITALDPAQPGFQNQSTEVRLSTDKARFVEVIHSDAIEFIPYFGFGYMGNIGHLDFYLNIGNKQPGCVDTMPVPPVTSMEQLRNMSAEDIKKYRGCSHGRAHDVYTAAVDPKTPCNIVGNEITTYTPVITSDQTSCGKNGTKCAKMGVYDEQSNRKGGYQVMTGTMKPFCCYNYLPDTGCKDTNITLTTPPVTTPTTPPVTTPTTPPVTTPTTPPVTTPTTPSVTTPTTPNVPGGDVTTPSVPGVDTTVAPVVG